MDFTAIDFETANSSRTSACSLGLVQVRAGVVTAEYDWLIDPRQRFDGMNIAIHGITPSMVKGEPTFAELWPTLKPLLQGEIVIAHNAAFDMSVLRYCLDDSSLGYPDFQYLCTYLLGKKMLQELPSHRLNVVSAHFGIRLKHHDALDDARASALILLKLMEQWQQFDPLLLADNQGYKAGTLFAGGYTPFKAAPKKPAKKPSAPKASAKTAMKTPKPAVSGIPGMKTPSADRVQDVTASVTPPIAVPPAPASPPIPELVRSQRVEIGDKLSASRLLVAVEWDSPAPLLEPEISACLLRETGHCEQDQDFVFYGNREDPSGSVSYTQPAPHTGILQLQLSELSASTTRIVLTCTLGGDISSQSAGQRAEQIQNASVSLMNAQSGARLARFSLDQDFRLETAIVIGEFYRYKGKWRFVAVGEEFPGGLRALCSHYGLEVEAEGPADQPAAESAASAETTDHRRLADKLPPASYHS
ncbi:TerD family protein [Paenibacillus tritici]|uniref:TerD family protein n=1 Tax=Paenibacillus tritici TaxID=1873425 RepID=A0ABX2DPN1_9BACL|nr:TerD family protein [Paenibacillus tritici]NQX45396.1 TerD family protein [Paenibacillus tritici]